MHPADTCSRPIRIPDKSVSLVTTLKIVRRDVQVRVCIFMTGRATYGLHVDKFITSAICWNNKSAYGSVSTMTISTADPDMVGVMVLLYKAWNVTPNDSVCITSVAVI